MTPAQLRTRKARIQTLNRALKKLFPTASIELRYNNPLELLVAVQLSAQCTDKMVNKITEDLFKTYKTLGDYVRAGKTARGRTAFEQAIKRSGFYHNKAKNILGAAAMLEKEFDGQVPKTIEEMLRLPGVARKTATVVLKEAYGITAGVTVDTHVIRFVQRFDLSNFTDPVKIERDLMQLLPKKDWSGFTHRVIHYGRYIAPARAYDISLDPLVAIYPKAGKQFRTRK